MKETEIFSSVITVVTPLIQSIVDVYANQKEAEALIIKDIEKSKTLRVYAMCGSTFSDKVNSNIAKKVLDDVNLKQSYLISGVDNNEKNIEKRQSELPRGATDLKTKIINSLNEFKAAKAINPIIEYRLHNKKVGFRLIILDECMYLSQQENNKYGKETEIQRISSDTPAYINFSAYFEELWNKYV